MKPLPLRDRRRSITVVGNHAWEGVSNSPDQRGFHGKNPIKIRDGVLFVALQNATYQQPSVAPVAETATWGFG